MKIQIKTSAENGGDRETADALNDPAKSAAQGSDAARDDAGTGGSGQAGFSPEAVKGAIRALLSGVGGDRGNGVVESWSIGRGAEDGNRTGSGNGAATPGSSDWASSLDLESALPIIGLLVKAVVELAAKELRRGGDGFVPGASGRENGNGDPPSPGGFGVAGEEKISNLNSNGDDPKTLAAAALASGRSVDGGQSELMGALISFLAAVRQNQARAIQAIADAAKNASAQQALIEDARRSIANLAMRIGQTNNVDHH